MVINLGDHSIYIDKSDYEKIKAKTITISWSGSKYYARVLKDGNGYDYLHRLIVNPSNGYSVDHINGNTLDNRRANLRECTHQQNMCNKKVIKRDLPRGVFRKKDKNKYLAQITINKKTKYLGYYMCPLMAKIAYEDARVKYMGEFARMGA